MNSNYILSFFIIISLGLVLLSSVNVVFAEQEFLLASWNLKDFWGNPSYESNGIPDPDKVENFALVLNGSNYPQVDKKYDIIFVQELKWNADTNRFEAFEILCSDYLDKLNYNCASVTAGTFNSEGYGVIYRNGIDVDVSYTGDPSTIPHWEQQSKSIANRIPEALARPPMMAKVSVDGGIFEFIVFNNHIKPSDKISKVPDDKQQEFRDGFGSYIPGRTTEYISYTEQELETIFEKIKDTEFVTDNIVVLGDLNADCVYLENDLASYDFIEDNDWTILTSDDTRTNFANKACWYDRIIVSDNMRWYFSEIGDPIGEYPPQLDDEEFRFIDSEKGLSDHKLIWAEFTIPDPIPDDPNVIILTEDELGELSLIGTISVIIGGIVYEIRTRRDT